MIDLLEKYAVSLENGFLPSEPPLEYLEKYPLLEDFMAHFTALLNVNALGDNIERLPEIDIGDDLSKRELERLHLIFSSLAHGFVWENNRGRNFLPELIVRPWLEICKQLQRLPVLTHSSITLQNWSKLNPHGPINSTNITPLIQFRGGQDESWFYIISIELEKKGAPLVVHGLDVISKNFIIAEDYGITMLENIKETLDQLIIGYTKFNLHSDPYVFGLRSKSFLAPLKEVEYRNEENSGIRSYFGGSMIQSSLIQLTDAMMGLVTTNENSRDYLWSMRDYMPSEHAAFLDVIEAHSPLLSFKNQPAYQMCLTALKSLKQAHFKMVSQYMYAKNISQEIKNLEQLHFTYDLLENPTDFYILED